MILYHSIILPIFRIVPVHWILCITIREVLFNVVKLINSWRESFGCLILQVILDVVYSHTAEDGDEAPKTISFRGIDNATYYILDKFGLQQCISIYAYKRAFCVFFSLTRMPAPWWSRVLKSDFGTANSFNCNHPIVQKLVKFLSAVYICCQTLFDIPLSWWNAHSCTAGTFWVFFAWAEASKWLTRAKWPIKERKHLLERKTETRNLYSQQEMWKRISYLHIQ